MATNSSGANRRRSATAVTARAKQATPQPPKRGRGRPRKIEPELLRERVLDAAEDVFANEGLVDASYDRIADACGIPRQTIYRMFGSKEGLFTAAVERALSTMTEHMARSIARNQNARGRDITTGNVRSFIDLMTKRPTVMRMLQLADSAGGNAIPSAARNARRSIERAMAAYIQQTWEGRRPLSEREARLSARLAVGMAETAVADFLEHGDFGVEELGDFLIDFIRTGFTTLRTRDPD